jgi:hypothetical protein
MEGFRCEEQWPKGRYFQVSIVSFRCHVPPVPTSKIVFSLLHFSRFVRACIISRYNRSPVLPSVNTVPSSLQQCGKTLNFAGL